MACGSNSAASSLAAASAVPNVTNHLSKMLSYMEWAYLLIPKTTQNHILDFLELDLLWTLVVPQTANFLIIFALIFFLM